MQTQSYALKRGQLLTYFDRTAVEAWARLTSDAPVSKVRATVRAGRDAMRATILDYLPQDLRGARLLDAGCGTGALAVEAARRGADVVAIDLSPTLVDLARERLPKSLGAGRITFHAGDMLDARLGRFDHVVAMDSLIHYKTTDMAEAVARLAARVERSIVFTFAPRTAALSLMYGAGKLFPRGDRSPSIVPVSPASIRGKLAAMAAHAHGPASWHLGRSQRIASGFYISQAQEVVVG
jgi:magnesium-protoporphyrin O-methyltransferase